MPTLESHPAAGRLPAGHDESRPPPALARPRPRRTSATRGAVAVTGAVLLCLAAAPAASSSSVSAASPVLAAATMPPPVTTAAGPTGAPAALQSALQGLVDAGATGAFVRVDDGHRVVTATAGLGRLAPPRPIRAGDEVRVGSITKTFMSVTTLQLVAEHRLSLDDTVQRWLPGQVPGGDAITVRMLLNHTSGLYNYTDAPGFLPGLIADPNRVWTPAEIVASATAHPPLFAPGQGWSYSNTNYILVGLILQKATGRDVADLVRRQITGPLHLDHTYLARTGDFRGPYAHGYATPALTGAGYLDVSTWNPSWAWTAGAMVSTAPDLSRFYQALLSGRLLPGPLLRQMLTTVDQGGGTGYGLGIFTATTPCGTFWGHNGGITGYSSLAVTDATGSRSAVLLVPTTLDPSAQQALGQAEVSAVCTMFDQPDTHTAPARATLTGGPAPSADLSLTTPRGS